MSRLVEEGEGRSSIPSSPAQRALRASGVLSSHTLVATGTREAFAR
jgi:hypothetical protein